MNRLIIATAMLLTASFVQAQTTRPVYQGEELKDVMKRVMRFQIKAYDGKFPVVWQAGAFWAGVTQAWQSTGDKEFYEAAKTWGNGAGWKPATRPFHADDMCAGQSYIDLYFHDKDPKMIEHIKPVLESYFTKTTIKQREAGRSTWREPEVPFNGRNLWWWCDALFMAPPVFTRMYTLTGDQRYLDMLHSLYWDSVDHLFDKEENLFYRDSNNFPDKKMSPNGKKVFWARGNGWVYAGLVRTIDTLPANDPQRQKYIDLFKKMTTAIIKYQGDDGCWRAGLNDMAWVPEPETSGTAFFVYGLLAGVNRGWLDRQKHLPIALKGWRGLLSNVNEEGRLGWAQDVGNAPAPTTADKFKDYANGAFLLAASELYVTKLTPQDLRK